MGYLTFSYFFTPTRLFSSSLPFLSTFRLAQLSFELQFIFAFPSSSRSLSDFSLAYQPLPFILSFVITIALLE